MLNVKERLSFACSKQVPVLVEELCCPDESGTLPRGVEEDLFEDQPVLGRLKPEALPRASHEGFGSVGRRLPVPIVGAARRYNRRNIEVGPERLFHLHVPQHGPGKLERFIRAVILGEH